MEDTDQKNVVTNRRKKPWCPLTEKECWREDCAWFDHDSEECAILTLSRLPRTVEYLDNSMTLLKGAVDRSRSGSPLSRLVMGD